MKRIDDRVSIVVLTAIELEYAAVRRRLNSPYLHLHRFGTIFEVGRPDDADVLVALASTGEGNVNVASLTERAITTFEPDAVLFVGMAGALKEDVATGDIVVATHIYSYHGGKRIRTASGRDLACGRRRTSYCNWPNTPHGRCVGPRRAGLRRPSTSNRSRPARSWSTTATQPRSGRFDGTTRTRRRSRWKVRASPRPVTWHSVAGFWRSAR